MENISEENQDGDNESQSNIDEGAEVRIEQEETVAASKWAQLKETDSMRTEELIAYMANLNAASQKVLLNANSVINACVNIMT